MRCTQDQTTHTGVRDRSGINRSNGRTVGMTQQNAPAEPGLIQDLRQNLFCLKGMIPIWTVFLWDLYLKVPQI